MRAFLVTPMLVLAYLTCSNIVKAFSTLRVLHRVFHHNSNSQIQQQRPVYYSPSCRPSSAPSISSSITNRRIDYSVASQPSQHPQQQRSRTFLHQSSRHEEGINSCSSSTNSISTTREIQWNMINLLRQEDDKEDPERNTKKRHGLMSLLHACRKVEMDRQRMAKTVENSTEAPVLPDRLTPYRRLLRTSVNAKDHQGCFRIFMDNANNDNSNSATTTTTTQPTSSIPSNLLFSMDQPLSFIRKSLSCQSDNMKRKRGGMMCDNTEAVVWCVSDDQDLEFASRAMDDMPFSQLHMGASMGNWGPKWCTSSGGDDDSFEVDLEMETLGLLESLGIIVKRDQEEDIPYCDPDDVPSSIGSSTTSTTTSTSSTRTTVPCNLKPQDLDMVQTVLSCNHILHNEINNNKDNTHQHKKDTTKDPIQDQALLDSQAQQTLLKLIDTAVESIQDDPLHQSTTTDEPHLVLFAHSISASIVAAAIATWKQQKLRTSSLTQVEEWLHQAVTVVTFGNICQAFTDGPAYIHISMWDDPWTRKLGNTRQNNKGGGRNAVYFHAWSPYDVEKQEQQERNGQTCSSSLKSHDAHNLNACAIQFLCLIMRINGIQSFRALYDAARYVDPSSVLDINPKHFAVDFCKQGDLVVWPWLDQDLVPAMIRATGGDQWLWNIDGEDDVDEFLPDEFEALSHLEDIFGYSAYEEIYNTCCSDC